MNNTLVFVIAMLLPFAGLSKNIPPKQKKSTLTHYANVDFTAKKSPFEIVHGIILVEANLDGQSGFYILDTGAPSVILNSRTQQSSNFSTSGMGGKINGQWLNVKQFEWAGVKIHDFNALAMDISQLEYLTGREITGVIGYSFFEDFELIIDLNNQTVQLSWQGKFSGVPASQPNLEIPFHMEGHLPVIEAKIGEKSFRFGIDTGASVNLINEKLAESFAPSLLAQTQDAHIVGMGPGSQEIQTTTIQHTKIGETDFKDMRFVFGDISHLKNLVENGVDGLLGFPFFQSGKFSINYHLNKIKIWK